MLFFHKAFSSRSSGSHQNFIIRYSITLTAVFVVALCLLIGPIGPFAEIFDTESFMVGTNMLTTVNADSAYQPLATTNLLLTVSVATANQITTNNDWSGVPGVEAYEGTNLSVAGTDPQTVLGTEFTNNALPVAGQTSVAANKNNPSAYNAGGIAEFDSGTELGVGLQGNVTVDNPYIVFYVNTVGVSSVYMSFDLKDIDAGNNNSISPVALQYRVGQTGSFTNIASAYTADATDGPNLSGRISRKSITLPAAVLGQSQVQIRLIANNAAGSDEWIGVNNVRISRLAPTAASVTLGGRVQTSSGMPVSKAVVAMTDGDGNIRTAISNGFGYYSLTDVPAGATYIFAIRNKRYTFLTDYEVYTAYDEFDGIDFIGYE